MSKGAPASPSGSRASHEAAARLHPPGFDPLRDEAWLRNLVQAEILRAMRVRRMKRADLARALKCSEARIHFMFRPNENLTLKTVERVFAAIGDFHVHG